MKKLKKAYLLAGAGMAIGLATAGAGLIHAASTSSSPGTGPFSDIVSAIATKFNLSTTDVQAVVDQTVQADQAKMEANRTAHEKTELDAAVKAGTITQAQEDLIVAKSAEVDTFMQGLKGDTQTARDAAIKTEQTALTSWATTNNIPSQFIPHLGGPGGPGGRGRMAEQGEMMGAPPIDSATTTTN